MITLVILAGISASFSFFLDYALGHPMSDNVSTKAILFRYSLWLAKRKLGAAEISKIRESFQPMISGNPSRDADTNDLIKKTIMLEGRKLFFYEQMFGMCPYCTNFWISQFFAVILYFYFPLQHIDPICYFVTIPFLSHTILRKL